MCDVLGICRGADYVPPIDAAIDAAPAFSPSNGVMPASLSGVTASIPGNMMTEINSDTGEIIRSGNQIRGPGTGVISGINYEQTASLGIFSATTFNLQAGETLRVLGVRGIVMLFVGDVDVKGTLLVTAGTCPDGSGSRECAGPGGGTGGVVAMAATGCAPGGRGVSNGDTGGGGGGFGEDGAPGGAETDELLAPGGVGGASASCPGVTLEPLVGGGGGGASGGAGGAGGGGGGALQITSYGSISVTGVINAGGDGGGASAAAGGGGGGAGGAILLEAAMVTVTGTLAANGGGGGEGAATDNGNAGSASALPAQGGDTTGRAGGDGGCLNMAPTAGAPAVNDTGGGGGAAGRIRINATTSDIATAVISPAPSLGDLKPFP
jgi:hypothetical protein